MSDVVLVSQGESDMSDNRGDKDALSYASSYESDVSDSEYEGESDYGSESDSDSISTHGTFASLAAALKCMSDQLGDLDGGFECVESSVRSLEKPALAVTVATYSQPTVLEAAPFRSTRFRWRPEASAAFPEIDGNAATSVAFSDICRTVRTKMLVDPTFLQTALGLPTDATFLEVLNTVMHRMVA